MYEFVQTILTSNEHLVSIPFKVVSPKKGRKEKGPLCLCVAEDFTRLSPERMSGSGRMMSRYYPFTEAQWQELETQALVYKYMVSGLQVPPELILSVRRSLDSNSSSLSFGPFPPQHSKFYPCPKAKQMYYSLFLLM